MAELRFSDELMVELQEKIRSMFEYLGVGVEDNVLEREARQVRVYFEWLFSIANSDNERIGRKKGRVIKHHYFKFSDKVATSKTTSGWRNGKATDWTKAGTPYKSHEDRTAEDFYGHFVFDTDLVMRLAADCSLKFNWRRDEEGNSVCDEVAYKITKHTAESMASWLNRTVASRVHSMYDALRFVNSMMGFEDPETGESRFLGRIPDIVTAGIRYYCIENSKGMTVKKPFGVI